MKQTFFVPSSIWRVRALAALVLLGGCMKSDPPQFHLNMVEMRQQNITEEQQQKIATILEAMFGTPDKPFVLPESGLDLSKIQLAAGPVWSDQKGRERGLYRQQCGHCHGTTGDGMGPTAAILNPYPRDYRQGKFKFKSTERAAKPTDADLQRILRQGIAGTAMPSFDLLPSDQIEALVEYVKYLSMRGQTELELIQKVADLSEGESLPEDREFLVDTTLGTLAEEWKSAADKIVNPEEKPEVELTASIDKGRELFYGEKTGNCFKCHGPSALGDGQTTDFDDWNKPLDDLAKKLEKSRKYFADRPAEIDKRMAEIRADSSLSADDKKSQLDELSKELASLPAEHAEMEETARVVRETTLPVRNIQPRNLRLGVYRGGRRPVDVFRRIYAGINGAPMPSPDLLSPEEKESLKANADALKKLQQERIWNLVDYVQSLPYETISKPPRQKAEVGRERM